MTCIGQCEEGVKVMSVEQGHAKSSCGCWGALLSVHAWAQGGRRLRIGHVSKYLFRRLHVVGTCSEGGQHVRQQM